MRNKWLEEFNSRDTKSVYEEAFAVKEESRFF